MGMHEILLYLDSQKSLVISFEILPRIYAHC